MDPDVAQTDEPYIFSNDDPLNAEDPLGMAAAALMDSGAISTKEAVNVWINMTIDALKSEGASVSTEALSDIKKSFEEDLSKPGTVITNRELSSLEEDLADTFGHIGDTLGFLGLMAVGLNDLQNHHDLAYTIGDIAVSYGGAVGGGIAGSAVCGGPLDPVDIGCVFVGAIVGGNVVPAFYHAITNVWKDIF
jgi:hypothetical protein